MSIRTFIAIELDEAIRGGLERLQGRLLRELPPKDAAIKWVRPENTHLTLKFLGDVEDAQLPEICKAVSAAAGQHVPFDFDIADCGCFPPNRPARVLWVGISEGLDPLENLQASLDNQLEPIGFARENRKFSPHLTLARIKTVKLGDLVRQMLFQFKPFRVGTQCVEQITVFQSELSRNGPQYFPLHHARLGAGK